MADNLTNQISQSIEEKPEKNTGKIVGGGVGLALGGAIGYLLLGPGAIAFTGVICALMGGALGAVFD